MHDRRTRCVGLFAILGLLTLLVGSGLAAASSAPAPTLTYTVAHGAIDNTVRLGPSILAISPRVVVGPDYANLSLQSVYMLGLNGSGSGACNPLTVFRSNDSGLSFTGPFPSTFCLPGTSLDAVVLANGTIVLASAGPRISVSYDGGVRWTLLDVLGTETTPPALAMDSHQGVVYLGWTRGSPGPLYVASSSDGGFSWGTPQSILPASAEGVWPALAAFDGNVLAAYLSAADGTVGDAVTVVASPNQGGAWSVPYTVASPAAGSSFSGPSVAVSPQGVFASVWYDSSAGLTGGQVVAAVTEDNGTSWGPPFEVGDSAPPQYTPQYVPHIAAFDSAGDLFVAWHNYSADSPLEATLNVAVSDRSLGDFNTSSFSLQFQSSAANGTQFENLGSGTSGQVFLGWDVYGAYASSDYGIFARSVTGDVSGTISGASTGVQLVINSAATNATVSTLPWTGTPIASDSLPPGAYTVWVGTQGGPVLAGTIPVAPWSETSFVVQLSGGTGGPEAAEASPWVILAALGGAIVVVGVLAGIAYTRITRETALQQKVRLLVYQYVSEHRGATFSQVRDGVGLQNGAAAYHLGVLEKQGLIQSVRHGRRRFYAAAGVPSVQGEVLVSEIQNAIIEAVRSNPGIGVREIGRSVGRIPSSVSYNVRMLAHEGLLRTERHGTRLLCFPTSLGG